MKSAIITGATGQDGSWLADLLIEKDYEVHALVRQSTQFTQDKWGHLRDAINTGKVHLHFGDLTDAVGMRSMIDLVQPDEVYNLAAQSHVGLSFEQPVNTTSVTALGPLVLLEAIRHAKKPVKFLQASSSEMFGKVRETPQNELTPFHPRSPYGCAKAYAHYIVQNYREAYGIYACSAISYNHESERRGENFVTRKITRAVGRIKAGLQQELLLGPTDMKRDWGYAPDYVYAFWMMLQREEAEDFVIGTGENHTVQEFVELAFEAAGLNWKQYVLFDRTMIRPAEVNTLLADPRRANEVLGWRAQLDFDGLVRRMVEYDVRLANKEKA